VVKAVIFDIDGTLVDSVDLHAAAWQQAFAKFGHQIPFERIRQQIGKGGDQLIPVFLSREELDRFGRQLEEYRSDLFKREYLPRVRPFPLVRELFERIRHDGKRVTLASSAKKDELAIYKRIARIEDLVETETSADDVERSKPYPDVFQVAAARAELRTIAVLCGGFAEADLSATGCIAIYRDPADLLARYEESLLARDQPPPPEVPILLT